MKLFLFCTLIAIPGLVRSLDVQCTLDVARLLYGIDNDKSCVVNGPLTVKTGEKLNIVSDINLNSIENITFSKGEEERAQISTVPSEIFQQLPNLKSLILHATVEVLKKGDFEKAEKLKYLTIENQLKTIPAGVLGSAKNLLSLTLSANKIVEIEDNAFNGLNALFYLNLEKNYLTIIKQNTFNGLEKLELLELDSNQIETIEENALNLPKLKALFMINNKLRSVPESLFSATSLEYLSLAKNKLADINLLAFSQMPALKTLYLSDNGLKSENIREIEIKELSKSLLSVLSLDHNELASKDDFKKFAIFPQLEDLNVQFNKYSIIDLGDKTLRQQFPKLNYLYISSGEWGCDWLKNFRESSEKYGIKITTTESPNTSGKVVYGIGCV